MPAHKDWSTFTFLFQDDVGGLELEDPQVPGCFVAAKPIAGACVLNVGDMLQRFSNGTTQFEATSYRLLLEHRGPRAPQNQITLRNFVS